MSPDPEPRFGRAALALLLAGLVALAAATLAGLEIERQGQRVQELDAALNGRAQPSRPACGDDPARRLEVLEQELRELGRIVRQKGR